MKKWSSCLNGYTSLQYEKEVEVLLKSECWKALIKSRVHGAQLLNFPVKLSLQYLIGEAAPAKFKH